MPLTWTDGAPVDGTTALTSARWEQLKTDLMTVLQAGGVDSAMLADGIVTRLKMAVGNRDVIQVIPVPMVDEVVLTTRVGFQNTATPKEFYGFTAKSNGTIVAVDYSADIVQTNTCRFEVAVGGTADATSRVDLAVSSGPTTGEVDGLAISVTDGDRVGVFVNAQGGTPTDVVGGFALIYFQRTLA